MKTCRFFSRLGISFAILCALSCFSAQILAATQPMDVILVMDSSGSMKKTDPNFLRKSAAKLFISLLGEEDRASVESFSDQGWPVSYLDSAKNPRSQKRHFAAVDKISTKGVYTNIPAALETALKIQQRNALPNRQVHVIMMSDGKLDVGSAQKNRQLRQQLIQNILPRFAEKGIKVHSIAFTDKSDIDLLKNIAQKSGGNFYLAQTDKQLHKVYTAIFENTKTPNQVPFHGDKFSLDASIREATVIGSKSGNKELTLVSPDNQRYSKHSAPSFINWFESSQFDLITIKSPTPGEWRLLSSDGDNKAYVITDLELHTEFSPAHPEVGEGVMIKSWLSEKKQKLTKAEILSQLQVNINVLTPEGETHHLAMEPYANYSPADESKAVFASYIAFPSKGRFQLNIQFDGKTFSRKAQLSVPVGVEASAATDPLGQAVAEIVEQTAPVESMAKPSAQAMHEPSTSAKVSLPNIPMPSVSSPESAIPPSATSANHETTTETETATFAEPDASDSAADHSVDSSPDVNMANPAVTPENASTDIESAIQAAAGDKTMANDADPEMNASLPNESSLKKKSIKKSHKKKGKHKDNKHKDNAKPAGNPEHDSSPLMTAIFVFVGINLFLAISGGLAYWMIQRKKSKSSEASDDSDEAPSADGRKEPQIDSKAA